MPGTTAPRRVPVLIVTTVLLSFISFWRAAATVLSDLGSTAYYIGGIAEHAIGRAAPWFILGVMLFSYAGTGCLLSRLSEDGVLSSWFRRPHPRYGTNYRLVNSVAALQLLTIIVSRGNVYLLGEAYAFGVVWSFAFKALATGAAVQGSHRA